MPFVVLQRNFMSQASKSTLKISENFFGIEVLKSAHPEIKKLKKSSPTSIHGNKFWGSSYLLMDYFSNNPLKKNERVMELGCGWGLAGIYLNKNFGCNVTGIDADDAVFPYMNLHAKINNAEVFSQKKYFEKITKKDLANYDVIIAADVCFWDELEDIHFNLIKKAIQAGVKKIIYADPERQPFINLAERCMESHFADVFEKELKKPVKARGSIMIIENA